MIVLQTKHGLIFTKFWVKFQMASVANLIPKLIGFVVYFTIQFWYYDKLNITKLYELHHERTMRKKTEGGQWKSPKISVRGDIQQKCTYQILLKNFDKFIKYLHKNLKNSPKFFKNKI